MITYIKIDDTEYPFVFGMREIYTLTKNAGVEFHEADQAISMEFDLMLEVYHLASKKGVRKHAKENGDTADQYAHLVLSKEAIEDRIDEDPDFFISLEEAFAESTVVQRVFDENKKKSMNQTTNRSPKS